mgnify:CR=1 FL=1
MNMDDISKLAQACFQSNPTLILGSGASMPHGLPSMGDRIVHTRSPLLLFRSAG